ncbi:hypothetical protein [Sphingobacterium lactis]|nr:hypothetical protein [Sphingobacterium lactis]
MLTKEQHSMITGDFEKFFKSLQAQNQPFTFEVFGEFAASILNFYVGSGLILLADKLEGAELLVKSFNAGLGNVITSADQKEIAVSVAQDPTLNYQLIQSIFG